MTNKGLIITNAFSYRSSAKYQCESLIKEFEILGIELCHKTNQEILVLINEENVKFAQDLSNFDFVIYLDKDKYISLMLEKMNLRLFNSSLESFCIFFIISLSIEATNLRFCHINVYCQKNLYSGPFITNSAIRTITTKILYKTKSLCFANAFPNSGSNNSKNIEKYCTTRIILWLIKSSDEKKHATIIAFIAIDTIPDSSYSSRRLWNIVIKIPNMMSKTKNVPA